MTNNKKVELLKERIIETETKINNETDLLLKEQYIKEAIVLRKKYTPLLLQKRPALLTFGIVFAIFWGISLIVCLPPFIIRGKKRDINEEKLAKLRVLLEQTQKQICLQNQSSNNEEEKLSAEEEIARLKKEVEELKAANRKKEVEE